MSKLMTVIVSECGVIDCKIDCFRKRRRQKKGDIFSKTAEFFAVKWEEGVRNACLDSTTRCNEFSFATRLLR